MSDFMHESDTLVKGWITAIEEDCAIYEDTIVCLTAVQRGGHGGPRLARGVESTVVLGESGQDRNGLLSYPMVYTFSVALPPLRSANETSSSNDDPAKRL